MSTTIDRATPADLDAFRLILTDAGLPASELGDPSLFFAAREANSVVGCVGIENHGPTAILRSLAVIPERRGAGLGRRLTEAALTAARDAGAFEVVALTYTAGDLFQHFGFELVDRSAVDRAALDSWQFASGVCDEAICLRLRL